MTSPTEVLDFWFGEGAFGNSEVMAKPNPSQMPLHWGMKVDMSGPISQEEKNAIDTSIRDKFAESIRACGDGRLTGPEWESNEGIYAK